MNTRRFIPVLSVLLMLTLAGTLAACPACKDSVSNSDAMNPGGVARGFNLSIYVMLGAFLCVLGFVGHIAHKAIRTTPVRLPTPGRAFPVEVKKP